MATVFQKYVDSVTKPEALFLAEGEWINCRGNKLYLALQTLKAGILESEGRVPRYVLVSPSFIARCWDSMRDHHEEQARVGLIEAGLNPSAIRPINPRKVSELNYGGFRLLNTVFHRMDKYEVRFVRIG